MEMESVVVFSILDQLKVFAMFLMAFIALFTLIKGLKEYKNKNAQDRAIIYLELRKRFKETENFSKIIAYLDSDDPKLNDIDISDKLKFLGYFEDVAVMVNSGLLDKRIASQSFGFYLNKAYHSPYMWWEGNKKDSEYRLLLRWLHEEFNKIHNEDRSSNALNYKF